ncbi:MAG: tetratricopeptide (TPR) repeat protein [Oceanospirillaceae bacterium]
MLHLTIIALLKNLTLPPRTPLNTRFNYRWMPLRYLGVAIACALIVSCSNPIKTNKSLQPHQPESLASSSLSDLLIGEFSLQRGDNEEAAIHLLAAAKSTQDLNTTKRATYAAQFSQNPDLLKQTSLLWSQLSPLDPLPWQYIAQAASLAGDFEQATKALAQELKHGGGSGLAYVASLSMSATTTKTQVQQTFESWLHIYPNHPQLLYSLALLAQNSTQIDTAIMYINKALAQDPHYLQAQVVYAELLLADQQVQTADTYLEQYTQPLAQAPRHLITLHAQVLTLMAKYQRAYDYFNELTRRYPDNLGYSYSAGLLAYETHQYALVYPHLQQVINLNPDSHSANYYMGLSSLRQDSQAQALDYFRQVTKGPDRINAITLLLDIESPDAGQRHAYFHRLRHQNQDLTADIYALETQYLQDIGDTESAALSYQQALKEHPDYIPLLYGYALLAQSLHQFNITELMLKRIIDIDPNHINALNALGYAYAEQGIKLTQAESLIRKALALDPNNAAIIDSLGWVSYRLGHLRQSLALLTQAYDILPDAEIAAHLGVVKWALGDTQSAFKTWNLALSRDPDNALIKQAILDAQNEFHSD